MNAIIYHGDRSAREELRRKHMPKSIGPKFPIVITSYEVAMNDAKKHLRHYNWKYLVVDEVLLVTLFLSILLCLSLFYFLQLNC